ncbi:DNA-formamidopyrimidine glycosylase [Paenibacillus daejeonensis]|uniref:DNA-formamidopyrimidine glycosylase n=1 Tax=Paenibacillus daejeonensis TaxID=135193 RepID=UPI0003655B8F|nr:DNA-formamidopyrimidine glycosylase [Paenibacillus daejeonensis]
MPELPEVETVRRTLSELVAGKTIERVTVHLPRIIQRPAEPEAFAAALAGRTIESVERRGKFLRLLLDGLVLVSHLRMEGRYGLFREEEPVEKHTHVLFHFTDGTTLRYKDVRQFGTMHLFEPGQEFALPPLNRLGVEPFSEAFTSSELRRMLSHKSTRIKPLLLNQEYVVGLGNIYVDEALFLARIHPERTADSLTRPEWQRLHEAILLTLGQAVEAGGSSIKSYVNGQGEMGMFQHQLSVYGRQDQPCPSCGGNIVKFAVTGRGTHICVRCQRAPRGTVAPSKRRSVKLSQDGSAPGKTAER